MRWVRAVRRAGFGAARVVSGLVVLGLLSGLASPARAQQALSLLRVGKSAPRIDGDLRDWRGLRFYRVGSDPAASFEYALRYDAEAIYLGARVYDDRVVRTEHPSPAEDAVILRLAMPQAGAQPRVSEVWLYSGIIGRTRARAAIGPPGAALTPSADVTVTEGPVTGKPGYVLEARVPLRAFPGGSEFMVGRGAIALHDVDDQPGTHATEIASARARRGEQLPPLWVEAGANAAIAAFLHQHDLSPESIRFDSTADLAGDSRLERVVLAGTFAAVAGPDIRGGAGYSVLDLPVPLASDVLDAELRPAARGGKAELFMRTREAPDTPHEYRWDGSRLAEVARKPPPVAAAPSTRPPAAEAAQARTAPPSAAEASPLAPGPTELVAEFKRARGLDPSEKPRFEQRVNLAEDGRPESLMVFGKDLVLVGRGFRSGLGYFFFTLPVREPADVLQVFTGDVTGDLRHELFVRVRQSVGDVAREILLGYTFVDSAMQPILAVEVRRAQGGSSIENRVELVPSQGHLALQISPGSASGWDAQSYPFVAESMDAYAPILLPWRNPPVRYAFDGSRLVASNGR